MTSAHWHSSIPPELRELCESVCKHAPGQIDALMLKSQGYGAGRIGRVLGITESAARGRLDRATLKIRKEQERREGNAGQN
jgi:hypothetical protein